MAPSIEPAVPSPHGHHYHVEYDEECQGVAREDGLEPFAAAAGGSKPVPLRIVVPAGTITS
jgi:hypothetical protein